MSQQVKVSRKLTVGTSTTPAITGVGVVAAEMYMTSSTTNTSASVESMYVKQTMTGAGGVGGRARFHMYTNVALGGWSNALKAYAEYGAAGRTTGLGSAFCAELALSAGTTQGTYAPLESEIIIANLAKLGTKTSFMYMNSSGADMADFDTSGSFFQIGANVTEASGKVLYDNTGAMPANTAGSLRFTLPSGASAYLMYYDSEAA